MAKKWGLPYRQKESFDICFIAGKDHNEFLKKYLKLRPGKIISKTPPHPSPYQGEGWGGVLGQHQGSSLYTIGQKAQVGGPGPYYVVGFNRKKNVLFVTNKPNDSQLYKKTLIAEKVNWILGQEPKFPLKCLARIRYGHQAVPAKILRSRTSEDFLVEFKMPQRAITPGQSVVFYGKKGEVLGGGIIL